MNELQLQLLQKVEEATLYTFDQHSDPRTLQEENSELRRRLERLETLLGEPASTPESQQ